MQKRHCSTPDLRALPQRERARALREQIAQRFGARVVGFRKSPPASPRRPRCTRGHFAAHAAVLAAFAAGFAFFRPAAAHAGTLNLDVNLASVHTERWARDSLNQRNPGVGVTYQWSRTWAVAGGTYSNSYRKPTAYALAEFTPIHFGQEAHWHLDAGIAAGFASGYTRAEIPCAPFAGAALVRITAPAGIALNVFAVPNAGAYRYGFVGLELSIPLRWGARR